MASTFGKWLLLSGSLVQSVLLAHYNSFPKMYNLPIQRLRKASRDFEIASNTHVMVCNRWSATDDL
jgi:hypothetical protein